MILPMCAPSKRKQYKTDVSVFEKDGIEIYLNKFVQYDMYKGEYYLATLLSPEIFENKYKGDFNEWIEVVKNKDMTKVKEFKEAVKIALQECDLIESLWRK